MIFLITLIFSVTLQARTKTYSSHNIHGPDDDKVVFLKGFSEQVHNFEPLNELNGDESDIMSLYEQSDCNEKQGKQIEEICSNLLIEKFQLFFIHKMHEATYNQNHQEFNCQLSKL